MTTTPSQQYEDVVDLRRYPINEPVGQACRDLVRDCRDQLRDRGVAPLPGFLTPDAVSQMIAEADRLAGRAWASDQSHTVYFEPPDGSAGADHPRALLQRSAKKAVAYDLIPDTAPIRRLYESAELTAFIAAVLGQHALHRVTPVSGPRPRINSVLTYGERPGMKLNRLTQELFYGRTA